MSTNTVAYSAGRVCYPDSRHALRAIRRERPGKYRGSDLFEASWWPETKPNASDVARVFLEWLKFPDTQRDYMPVEEP